MQKNLKGSYPHIVEMQDDLMHLAEIFYGDTNGWKDIYWANLDVYGDDFEKIPVGTTIHIPVFEDKDVRFKYRGAVWGTNAMQAILPSAPVSANYDIIVNDSGAKNLVIELNDGSSVMVGSGGVACAKESMAVNEDVVSNAMGDTAPTITLTGNQDAIDYSSTHRGVHKPSRKSNETMAYIPNIMQQIATIYYGNDYYYYPLLRANNMQPETIVNFNQVIYLPSRGKKYNLELAHRWKVNLGNT